jgi:hypothetical protein
VNKPTLWKGSLPVLQRAGVIGIIFPFPISDTQAQHRTAWDPEHTAFEFRKQRHRQYRANILQLGSSSQGIRVFAV